MHSYKILKKQVFSSGEYSIVPIRSEDRYAIMEWRNEQMYHLRQSELLTVEKQDNYFNKVISKLFDKEKPDQILFSYLKGEECIGYGGLVHINWIDKNAEISFVLNTKYESKLFKSYWSNYLKLIEEVASNELKLHKIYTYAFDLRPKLYEALEKSEYFREATLKNHCYFEDNFIDVVIHSKILSDFYLRKADINDAKLLFDWVNDPLVRKNSLSSNFISWEKHLKWFYEKLFYSQTVIFIVIFENQAVGQVRLDFVDKYWLIDYSVSKEKRGKGFGKEIISKILHFKKYLPLKAYVKADNIGSIKVFQSLGFKEKEIDKDSTKIIEFTYE